MALFDRNLTDDQIRDAYLRTIAPIKAEMRAVVEQAMEDAQLRGQWHPSFTEHLDKLARRLGDWRDVAAKSVAATTDGDGLVVLLPTTEEHYFFVDYGDCPSQEAGDDRSLAQGKETP